MITNLRIHHQAFRRFAIHHQSNRLMKKILLTLLALVAWSATAQTTVHYGYTPDVLIGDEIQAQGTGENAFVAAMICLDPTTDPVVQRLKGQQIKGVRCFLRDKYEQKRQKYSQVMHTIGSADATPTTLVCNFKQGWNEILFDEPITIGDEKIFVGMQVYELRGTPYPFVSYAKASVPGGCWINLKREGWKEYTDRGTLCIQAILDDEAAPLLERTLFAQASSVPLTVAPSSLFKSQVYILNHSAQAVNSIELTNIGQGDTDPYVQTVNFDTPLEGYNARLVELPLRSGSELGTTQWMKLNVTAVDGKATQAARDGVSTLYVTEDAFVRIPLIEQFTSQRCTNCPFMIYYLDKAIEEFNDPVLYVTHHSGYQKDAFTKPMDEELLYLFGEENTFNPAVMYDRVVPKGEISPIIGASEASTAPYTAAMQAALLRPAMAKVVVDIEKEGDKVSCHVHGRINREMAASGEQLYLSVYLIENHLSTEEYMQMGLDGDGAPADIVERFKHNGIKRHIFNQEALGDPITLTDDCTYSMNYDAATIDKSWNWDNCQVVAFVHKVDKTNITNNEVLNAGSNRLNGIVNGIDAHRAEANYPVRFITDGQRMIQANLPLKHLEIYDLSGKRLHQQTSLTPGVYVVRYTLPNGQAGTQKLMVK